MVGTLTWYFPRGVSVVSVKIDLSSQLGAHVTALNHLINPFRAPAARHPHYRQSKLSIPQASSCFSLYMTGGNTTRSDGIPKEKAGRSCIRAERQRAGM